MQQLLAKRRAVPVLGALTAVLWLLYRRYSKGKKRSHRPPRSAQGGAGDNGASSSLPGLSAKAQPPPENRKLAAHVEVAVSWHRQGLQGQSLLGEDDGIQVFSAPQDPLLATVMSVLTPLGRSGEAAVAAVGAFVLVLLMAAGVCGRALPFVGLLASALGCMAIWWVAGSLEHPGKGPGVAARTVERWLSQLDGRDSSVLLHGVTEVRAHASDGVWQALYRRATESRDDKVQGFARRNELAVLVDVKRSAATGSLGAPEARPGGGVRGAFVLCDFGRAGLEVHHYAGMPTRLAGPAATAAAAAPLRALLKEAADLQKGRDGDSVGPDEGAEAAAREEATDALVQQALQRAAQLSDGLDGGVWVDEEPYHDLRLSSQDIGSKFPLVRGVLEVPKEVVQSSSPQASPAAASSRLAAEIVALQCSAIGQQLIDVGKGGSSLIERRVAKDKHKVEECSSWFSHLAWKAHPLESATDGVFLECLRRSSLDSASDSAAPATGSRRTGGERFTCVAVPAPADALDRFAPQLEAARAKQVKGGDFRPRNLTIAALDVYARADGSLRLCYCMHRTPEVSRLVPASKTRAILLQAPRQCLALLDMAQNLSLPEPVAVQSVPLAEEEFEEVCIAGRKLRVSRCVAALVADRLP